MRVSLVQNEWDKPALGLAWRLVPPVRPTTGETVGGSRRPDSSISLWRSPGPRPASRTRRHFEQGQAPAPGRRLTSGSCPAFTPTQFYTRSFLYDRDSRVDRQPIRTGSENQAAGPLPGRLSVSAGSHSSVKTPCVLLGWTKAIRIRRAPSRGTSSIILRPDCFSSAIRSSSRSTV